jgi:hypothetical protein
MQAYTQRVSRKRVALPTLLDYWCERIERLLRAAVRDRDVVPEAESLDSTFHVFMADPMETLERVYATAGLELTDTARAQLGRYVEDHPRGKEGQVVYDLRADFGVDPKRLRERFRFYFDRFPIRAEVL